MVSLYYFVGFIMFAALILYICVGSYRSHKAVIMKKRRDAVAGFSTRYANLKLFVRSYPTSAMDSIAKRKTIRKNSLAQFREFDCVKEMKAIIRNDVSFFENMLYAYDCNCHIKRAYDKALVSFDRAKRDANYEKANAYCKMSFAEYKALEDNMCLQLVGSVPMDFSFELVWSYTSPKGRNHYEHNRVFVAEEIRSLLDDVTYVDSVADFKKQQRRMLTPKLRYEILQRDNFTCVLCGRSSERDGVKLEVDHIVPVSKGGRTERGNLRTLCWDCNRGKGSRIEFRK